MISGVPALPSLSKLISSLLLLYVVVQVVAISVIALSERGPSNRHH